MAASLAGGEPPESTRLRIGDDISWSEISGVYDRDDSLKENTNPKCLLTKQSHTHGPGAGGHGSSQRFSGNLKPTAAPIIGLSGGKLGLGSGSARRHHHPPAMLFFFPGNSKTGTGTGGGGRAAPRAATALPEPASPKVSCIGRVRSERERARLRSRRGGGGAGAPGCCGALGLLMSRAVECVDQSPPPALLPEKEEARRTRREAEEVEADVAEPAPALGGMRRFASGRRAAEWAAGMEDEGHVARSGPL